MKREGTLSVVIPAFNEESNIQLAEQTISKILDNNGIAYRIFFVDDEQPLQQQLAVVRFNHNRRLDGRGLCLFRHHEAADKTIPAGRDDDGIRTGLRRHHLQKRARAVDARRQTVDVDRFGAVPVDGADQIGLLDERQFLTFRRCASA